MIRGQGHHLRSPKGQYPFTTGKFGIKSFREGIIKNIYISILVVTDICIKLSSFKK